MLFGISLFDCMLIVLGLACCAIIVATLVRLWIKITAVRFTANVNLSGKTVIITGANSGIGKETAKYMAKNGARVIMACRSMESAKKVRDEICAESENTKIILHYLDLSSFQSVRQFCDKIIETEPKIDILIHNAGYGGVLRKAVSADGIEYTMATNHYGPFLMTNLLADVLKKSAPCRIVVLSSKAHTCSRLNRDKDETFNPLDFWFPLWTYASSKLANILFTFELARRTQGTGITVNALHPGTIDSSIWRHYPFPLNLGARFCRLFMRTVEEGAQTTLYVALSTNLNYVSGKYFRNCREGTHSKEALDVSFQEFMWEKSRQIVQLAESDIQF